MTNKILIELIMEGFPLEIFYNEEEKRIEYRLDGFYKSGQVRFTIEDDKLIAHTRYNTKDEINDLQDLVLLNYNWWQNSIDRYDGWTNPETKWIPLLQRYGFIKKEESLTVKWLPTK